ncbi:MAG: hypothetical protein A2V67_07890 [Deltaproteobacteria bacterium RBG_13_61_14]|nr:MAG: hypothetical protein A2V67_07890 [Deltaproteobacteria bacterium RBG_13_61_14]
MKFMGDADGIAELKTMKETRLDWLKYLLKEAQTNFDNTATFKGQDNKTTYKIVYSPQTGELNVEKLK